MLLSASGVAGNPKSYFHRASVAAWAAALGIGDDPAAPAAKRLTGIFAAARTAGRGGTGVFGLRVQAHSLRFLRQQLATLYPDAPTDRERFDAAFGRTRFIHLRRADKLAQAVSCLLATQTGLWHVAADGRELERIGPAASPVYNADAIRDTVEEMTAYDRLWEAWFEAENLSPLRIDYDHLAKQPKDSLRAILEDLQCDSGKVDALAIPTRRLANATNREWIARFRAEDHRG